jgi:hypothetical protein
MTARTESTSLPGVLHLIHGHGGGTEHHVRALIDASRTACRHHLAFAIGDTWRIDQHRSDGTQQDVRLQAFSGPELAGFRR